MTRELTETEKTILVLDQAKELIRDPKRWTKGQYHREGPDRWCMLGAVDHVVPLPADAEAWEDALAFRRHVCDCLEDAIGGRDPDIEIVAAYNDQPHRTHAQVMKAFDRAIKLLRKKQP